MSALAWFVPVVVGVAVFLVIRAVGLRAAATAG